MRIARTALALAATLAVQARAQDIMVSANDGKFVRKDGGASYPRPAPSDSLAVLDLSAWPPKIKTVVEGVEHTLQGPPQAVAITPDRRLVVVGAPDHYDDAAKADVLDTFLQVVDLSLDPPRMVARVELGAHPNGLSISPDGRMLLAAMLDGNLAVCAIDGAEVRLVQKIRISNGRLSGVSFTHDGRAALVALRDQGGLAVLRIADGKAELTDERVSTGVAPYGISISGDGKWAVAGSAGLAGLSNVPGKLPGDADLVTLIDVSRHPFRAVQHITTPSVPEGVAISPDGRWIAVQAMDGSNLPHDNPGHGPHSNIVLYALRRGQAVKVDEKPSGVGAQGLEFAADSRTLIAQFNVERQLAVFQVRAGRLVDTHVRLNLAAGPASLRAPPR